MAELNSTNIYGNLNVTGNLTGVTVVGTGASPRFYFSEGVKPSLQVEGISANTSSIGITRNENSGEPSYLILSKSRGTTANSVTIVQDADALGALQFEGTDGTRSVPAAQIRAEVDGTPGVADMPGRLIFYTCSDGSAAPTERMRISSTGLVSLTGNLSLDTAGSGVRIKEGSNAKMGVATLVAGTVTVSNTSVTANSRIFLTVQSLGTVTVPSAVGISDIVAGTSFTIKSSASNDTSVVAWHIIEPA